MSGVNIINPDTLDFLLFDDFNGLLGTFTLSGVTLPGMVVGLLLPLQSGDYFTAMETYNVGLLTVVDIASYAETWVGLGLLGSPTQFENILTGRAGYHHSWRMVDGRFRWPRSASRDLHRGRA